MELVTYAKEVLQSMAEQAASYRFGQTALRQLDRALWVVEKCARWAVPPPLDQDERPQPDLVRPLPWVFFLVLLVMLRVTRESISLLNLAIGKPPLRSADVVMYIQSKRRYLRTLKYQGNRAMRARSSSANPPQNWFSKIQALFEVTMCFRGRESHYGNNNTSAANEELLVIKRSKRTRDSSSPLPSASETSMERLIEKMMADMDADSDEDSSYTLTNATSLVSDRSDTAESDQDTVFHHETSPSDVKSTASSLEHTNENSPNEAKPTASSPEHTNENSPNETKPTASSPEHTNENSPNEAKPTASSPEHINENSPPKPTIESSPKNKEKNNLTNDVAISTPEQITNSRDDLKDNSPPEDKMLQSPKELNFTSPKTETVDFLNHEMSAPPKSPSLKYERKIANGRPMSAPNKKRGNYNERRDVDASVTKNKADRSF